MGIRHRWSKSPCRSAASRRAGTACIFTRSAKCEPDFTAAGGHFDPGPAGNTDPDANHPFHMGDIPNLEVGANGQGQMKITTTRVTLSPGPLSLFDADGTAIIIHGNPDQGTTGEPKSGVSGGPRVACGVVDEAVDVIETSLASSSTARARR